VVAIIRESNGLDYAAPAVAEFIDRWINDLSAYLFCEFYSRLGFIPLSLNLSDFL